MPFLDEQMKYLSDQGVATRGTSMFGTSGATIPTGDGPYLNLSDTGGMTLARTQTGGWQRPSAQLVSRAKDVNAARGQIRRAYNAYVNDEGLPKVRNMTVGAFTVSITSITRVGAVATVTTSGVHRFISEQVVEIQGATQAEYNGDHRVTVPTGSLTTFTFAVSGAPVTPATGTMTAIFAGTFYQEVAPVQEPFDLGLDESGRARYAFNINAVKAPS